MLIVSDEKPGVKKSLADAFKRGGLARKMNKSQNRKKTQTRKEKTKEELAELRKKMMKRTTVKDDETKPENLLEFDFKSAEKPQLKAESKPDVLTRLAAGKR